MKFNLHHKEVRQISLILSILLKPKKQDRKWIYHESNLSIQQTVLKVLQVKFDQLVSKGYCKLDVDINEFSIDHIVQLNHILDIYIFSFSGNSHFSFG
jgi:hypothetical protein